ncbi:MAG: D-hexose-6-phosphate mutarotase [Ignavibacteriales bacterium]|nr:D-hexose-6-phosphate mutarotase [Ignavibacteriales bacterium]
MIDIQALNDRFGIHGHLVFKDGTGGLPFLEIQTKHAEAVVSLYGAHVMKYVRRGEKPVLWMSKCSFFEPGKPIRGGIPVCWPWFSAHPRDHAKPLHGFARLRMWTMLSSTVVDDAVEIRLGLLADEGSRSLWPHGFQVQYTVTVGPTLKTELLVMNTDASEMQCTAALHTYFNVGSIRDVVVSGLDGVEYLDKMDGGTRKRQEGDITFDRETDRIYLDTTGACSIEDKKFRRTIRVEKTGSRSTVVWNPWILKSKKTQDFGDTEYETMVCVETANAADDIVTIPPFGSHRLGSTIVIE